MFSSRVLDEDNPMESALGGPMASTGCEWCNGAMRDLIDERRGQGLVTRGSIAVAGALVLVALLVVLVKWGASWLAGGEVEKIEPLDKRLDALDAARGRILQILAGAGALAALWFTARSYHLSREGQVTDRYTNAVDQLGADALEQRVGGVYALERIMSDSPRDHSAVVEVLIAFVRERAPIPKDLAPVGKTGPAHEIDARRERRAGPKPARPPADIQAAMIVLGRRPKRPEAEVDALRLSDTVLRRSHMRGARLHCVRLRDSHLEYANMERAGLQGARMRRAHLEYADLRNADLEHAYLSDAHLEYADLTGATLDRATLTGAHLADATLEGASLVGAHLAGATGAAALTPEQQQQAHCRPGQARCDRAGDTLPKHHPCARYEW